VASVRPCRLGRRRSGITPVVGRAAQLASRSPLTPKLMQQGTGRMCLGSSGRARVIADPTRNRPVSRMVTCSSPTERPRLEPILKSAAGESPTRGGRTCHAAIIAPVKWASPRSSACGDRTTTIADGETVTASCSRGGCGSRLPRSAGPIRLEEQQDIGILPPPRHPDLVKCGQRRRSFQAGGHPCDGVGLAMEFIHRQSRSPSFTDGLAGPEAG